MATLYERVIAAQALESLEQQKGRERAHFEQCLTMARAEKEKARFGGTVSDWVEADRAERRALILLRS